MSKIIGKCLGEYIKKEDVFYDPQKDVYKIKAGDKIVEIPGYALQSEDVRTLKEALSNIDDENRRMDILSSWTKARSNPTYIDSNSVFVDTQVPHQSAKEIADQTQEAVIKLRQQLGLTDDNLDAKYRRTYLGEWGPRALGIANDLSSKTSAVGAPFDSQAFDPLRVRVEAAGASVRSVDSGDWSISLSDKAAQKLAANSAYGNSLGTAGHTSAPWDDPLKGQAGRANDIITCIDLPEWRPGHGPNTSHEVYYQDRFPSIPVRSIIDDAIELLNKKKNLHITKITFSQSHPDFRLAISSDLPNKPEFRRTLEVLINHVAFDRAYKTDLDEYAKLKARLDTNTYIKLRIAFLLYEALKLSDSDAKKISLGIFKIIGSDTRHTYHF